MGKRRGTGLLRGLGRVDLQAVRACLPPSGQSYCRHSLRAGRNLREGERKLLVGRRILGGWYLHGKIPLRYCQKCKGRTSAAGHTALGSGPRLSANPRAQERERPPHRQKIQRIRAMRLLIRMNVKHACSTQTNSTFIITIQMNYPLLDPPGVHLPQTPLRPRPVRERPCRLPPRAA